MSQRNKKTVIKTIRISKQINDFLDKDAVSKRISVNALISIIMTKYVEWDRYVERFGGITINPRVLRDILLNIDDERLISMAKKSGSQFPKEFVLFRYKKANLETYVESLMLICKYKGYAQYEIETDGTNYTITLVHDLGEKWSKFLRYVIEEGMKSTVGIVPKFDITQGSLMVTFSR